MLPAIRLLPISLLLAAAFAPVSARAGADLDKIVARMLVGKDGARIDTILNSQLRTVEFRTLGFDGVVIRRDILCLAASREPVAWTVFDGKGKLRQRCLWSFDESGRRGDATIYNKSGKMVRRVAAVE